MTLITALFTVAMFCQPANALTQPELTAATVHGIGPVLAERIVQARIDDSSPVWEQVDAVPGIGPKRLEALLDGVIACATDLQCANEQARWEGRYPVCRAFDHLIIGEPGR